jgi:hypothetical protein
MTDLTKARLLTLMLSAKEGSLVACETPAGVCVGIVDDSGFIPIAAIWPDDVDKVKPRSKAIGFLPPPPIDGMVN